MHRPARRCGCCWCSATPARWRTASTAACSTARPAFRELGFLRFNSRAQVWLLLEFCDRGTLADGINRGLFLREPSFQGNGGF